MDTTTPDLDHYYAMHNKMRIDLARFVAALQAIRQDSDPARVAALARWATGFAHELHLHHTVEDDVIFVDLAARVPAVNDLLVELGHDHDRVAELLRVSGLAAGRLADRRQSFEEARSTLLAISIELRDLLDRHLDIEDDDVLPLFAEHYTAAEYDALTQKAMKSLPKKGLFFSIPWNVAAQSPARREEMLAEAPGILRLIFRLANGRYQRLVATAFAEIPAPALMSVTTTARSSS
jgi:hemerythrin-like domain-containing protein